MQLSANYMANYFKTFRLFDELIWAPSNHPLYSQERNIVIGQCIVIKSNLCIFDVGTGRSRKTISTLLYFCVDYVFVNLPQRV